MVKNDFMESLTDFMKNAVKDFRLPVVPTREEPQPEKRAPALYKMMLPDMDSSARKAPYIINHIITAEDEQLSGENTVSKATVRTIFCVYCEGDKEEGGMTLLEVVERVRIALLKERVLSKRYQLQMAGEDKMEYITYTESTAPYFMAEMKTVWRLPSVEREVTYGNYGT